MSYHDAGDGGGGDDDAILGQPHPHPVGPQPQTPQAPVRTNKFETSLQIRLDFEAALAYAAGPVSAVILLILETKNDYVRFHAWQSALVFVSIMIVQFFFSLFSSTMVWLIFCLEIVLAGWLGYHAYISADSLERYKVPYFGPIASSWVDSE